jgi:hypothetical protein
MTSADQADPFRELAARVDDHPAGPAGNGRAPAVSFDDRLLSFADLLELQPPALLVEDLLYLDTVAVIFGPSGGGKTFLALDLAWCVAGALPWQGRAVHGGQVLYVLGEGRGGIGQRAKAWKQAFGADDPAGFRLYPDSVSLLDPDHVRGVAAWAAERRPVLVVLDTLARAMPGGDENTARDMGAAIAGADAIRRASGACVLLVHHTGKDGLMERGSSALRAAADTVLPVKASGGVITIGGAETKQKDADPGREISVYLVPITLPDGSSSCVLHAYGRAHEHSQAGRDRELVRAALADDYAQTGAGRKLLVETLDMSETRVSRAVNALIKDGLVVNEGSRTRPHFRTAG